ncbi:hypothetical protein [Glutamicibacter endophyticus]|uniref:hypothetical protein n=1 Tax=Glutamicibacter endophyticus TaxID=1522174 RepID=UPI003AEF6597
MDIVEILSSGQRGRRLLFEMLREHEDRALNATGGTGPLLAWMLRHPEADCLGPGAGQIRNTCAERLAEALDQCALPEPSAASWRRALYASVERAAYWQPADSVDILLGYEEVRPALRRVARHLAQHWPARFAAPVQREAQFQVAFVGDNDIDLYAYGTRPPAEALGQWHEQVTAVEHRNRKYLVRPIQNCPNGKWWVTPGPGLYESSATFADAAPLALWCQEDDFGWTEACSAALRIPDDGAVYEVHQPADWAELCRRYPLEVSANMRRVWWECTGRDGRWVIPNWQQVARDYIGVHLSVAGYLGCAGEVIDVGAETASMVAGWAPDVTYWFDPRVMIREPIHCWSVRHVEGVGEQWERVVT